MNLLILGAAGLGLLALASSSSAKPGASTAPNAGPKKTALDFQTRIADALSKGDAGELLKIADEMQAAGLTAEAQALRASALSLQQLGALGGSAKTPGAPVLPPSVALPNPPNAPPVAQNLPSGVSLPPLIVPSTVPLPAGTSLTPEAQKRLAVAQGMAMNLRNTSRYQEDKKLIVSFQSQEGLKTDGLYGPKSALALVPYGVVPPRPRYWNSKTLKVDRAAYVAAMLAEAKKDPSRAPDWTAASKVQSDPVK